MFQVSEISFCDKKALNIKSDDFKKSILDELNSLFNVNIMNRHYEVLNSKNIIHLNNNPYVVSVKSSEGNSYYLYCFKHNDVNTCIFIDRKVCKGYSYPRMICIKYLFDDCVFNNTLFEGELIKNGEKDWVYMINDIISYNGTHLTNVNLIKRLSIVGEIVEKNYNHDNVLDICRIQVKKYFDYNDFDMIMNEFIPSLSYKSKGLIFKSIHLKFPTYLYVFENDNNNNTYIKKNNNYITNIKPSYNNHQNQNPKKVSISTTSTLIESQPIQLELDLKSSYDFKIVKGDKPDTYTLYKIVDSSGGGGGGVSEIKSGSEIKVGLIGLPSLKTSKMVSKLFTDKRESTIKCEYNDKLKKWIPVN